MILPSTWHQRAVVDALLYLAREDSLATHKKQKLPCRRCGKETAVATHNDRLRHAHLCPHGKPCMGGNPLNSPCPDCAKKLGYAAVSEQIREICPLLTAFSDMEALADTFEDMHDVGKAAPNSPRKS